MPHKQFVFGIHFGCGWKPRYARLSLNRGDLILIKLKKGIQFVHPILHHHRDLASILVFSVIEEYGNNPFQSFNFPFRQVILGNGYI
jgi:hypothetical protein